ncbi:MAG: flavodoxin family protein [Ruminococcus sp.]|nr:flavodoxin family protein [Ruminococcus sp.]
MNSLTNENRPKKILIINGSPKGANSLTFRVAGAFAEGLAAEEGSVVENIHVSQLRVRPCTGCLSCWGRTEGKCVMTDDSIPEVREKILAADTIITAFPIYFFGMPGTMKTMIDRLLGIFCTFHGQELDNIKAGRHALRYPREGQRLAVIASCGFSESEDAFYPIKVQFDLAIGEGKYAHFCCPQLKALAQAGSGQRFEKILALSRQAGAQFAHGSIDPALTAALEKPVLSQKTYRMLMEKFWQDEKGADQE